MTALLRYPLFALLSEERLAKLLANAQEVRCGVGETVFQEGTPGAWAYLVLEGQVRAVRRRRSGGSDATLGLLGPGEVFGEYALLPPHHNTATCRAVSPTRLLQIPLGRLRMLLEEEVGPLARLKEWLRLHALATHQRGGAFLAFMSAPSGLKHMDALQTRTFDALRTIQTNGLNGECWFLIESGQVALTSPGGALRELGPGDQFGERGLLGLDGLPTAVALSETRCLTLPRARFDPSTQPSDHAQTNRTLHIQLSSFPWIGQHEAADCGAAALTMIVRAVGRDTEREQVRRRLSIGPQGASLMDLARVAGELGLKCEAARVSPDQLNQATPPFIAHQSGGHYVTVYHCTRQGVVLGDPASGILRQSFDSFAAACSGKLLIVRCPRNATPPAAASVLPHSV